MTTRIFIYFLPKIFFLKIHPRKIKNKVKGFLRCLRTFPMVVMPIHMASYMMAGYGHAHHGS
jgi:hypothetical protein